MHSNLPHSLNAVLVFLFVALVLMVTRSNTVERTVVGVSQSASSR